jgi:hypothetical protein
MPCSGLGTFCPCGGRSFESMTSGTANGGPFGLRINVLNILSSSLLLSRDSTHDFPLPSFGRELKKLYISRSPARVKRRKIADWLWSFTPPTKGGISQPDSGRTLPSSIQAMLPQSYLTIDTLGAFHFAAALRGQDLCHRSRTLLH